MPRAHTSAAAGRPLSSSSRITVRAMSMSAWGGLALVLSAGPVAAASLTGSSLPVPVPGGNVLMPVAPVALNPTVPAPIPTVVIGPTVPAPPAIPTAPGNQPLQPPLPAPVRPAPTPPVAPPPVPVVVTVPDPTRPIAPGVVTAPGPVVVRVPTRQASAPQGTAAGPTRTPSGAVVAAPSTPTVGLPPSGTGGNARPVVIEHVPAQLALSPTVYRSTGTSGAAHQRTRATSALPSVRLFDRASRSSLYGDHRFPAALTQLLYAGAGALALVGALLLAGGRGLSDRLRRRARAVAPDRSAT